MSIKNLLFIDTNIWLDFYRARNETGLQLLAHVEAISESLIVTYQLESEFKRNRQAAILEGMQELKPPQQVSRIGIFSDAKATKIMARDLKETAKRVKSLRRRLERALNNPGVHDPVYKICQRIFHKTGDLVLKRDNVMRHMIRRKAFRRFLHGCPPRKRNDTSIGDAFNWEWMVYCANQKKAGLVIVSRDADYGVTVDDRSYVNDHLRQEFSDRVSRKRSLQLFSRLSDALKLFQIDVSPQEEQAEKEIVSTAIQHTSAILAEDWALGDLVNKYQSLASMVDSSTLGVGRLASLASSAKLSQLSHLAGIRGSIDMSQFEQLGSLAGSVKLSQIGQLAGLSTPLKHSRIVGGATAKPKDEVKPEEADRKNEK